MAVSLPVCLHRRLRREFEIYFIVHSVIHLPCNEFRVRVCVPDVYISMKVSWRQLLKRKAFEKGYIVTGINVASFQFQYIDIFIQAL